MEEIDIIRLHIDRQVFTARRDLLCEYSDYFRAMFSGNYKEKEQNDVTIDVDAVDAYTINIILRYMNLGLIDLAEYQLPAINKLSLAANFLQMAELTKQIEYYLELQLSPTTWMETLAIAENATYIKLIQPTVAFGLFSFKDMTVQCIPTIERLFWYLSNPYLDTSSEVDVFKFGLKWILSKELGADALLIILGCLDMKKLKLSNLEEIKKDMLLYGFENSLPEKIVECLHKIRGAQVISETVVTSNKQSLCELFTESVYAEVFNLVRENKERKLTYQSVIPVWLLKDSKLEFVPHFMYTFSAEAGFKKWLEVADKHLWGWSVVSWGSHSLVVVGGELGRGTGNFVRDVKVYDTFKKEWISHGVQLPPRRHGGVAVLGDDLFLVGGVGGFRLTLDTAITYDLKERSFRAIAKLPDALQSPAICTHNGKVYAGGHKNVYLYDNDNGLDQWKTAILTEMRTNRMTSFMDYIYCTQNYFSQMFRFKPGIDEKLELIINYSHPPAAICNFSDRLVVFTRPSCAYTECITVEEYRGEDNKMPKILLMTFNSEFTVNDVAGSCTLVLDIPPVPNNNFGISPYHQNCLSRYSNVC